MLRTPTTRTVRRTVSAIMFVAAAASTVQSCTKKFDTTAGAAAAPASGVDIPRDYLALYQASGTMCRGLSWQILAGIGKIESDHGRSPLPGVHSSHNPWGAAGPMQFIDSTWAMERRRHPDIGPDMYDPANEIPAAAHLLCDQHACKRVVLERTPHAVVGRAERLGRCKIEGDCADVRLMSERVGYRLEHHGEADACGGFQRLLARGHHRFLRHRDAVGAQDRLRVDLVERS